MGPRFVKNKLRKECSLCACPCPRDDRWGGLPELVGDIPEHDGGAVSKL